MKVQEYLTVKGEFEKLNIIERSKFICYVKGVDSEDEAKAFIDKIRKEHSLATHNCYAYIADELGLIQKFSDDGEPQGTAGMPILEVLRNRKIYKTVVVVTRYFGGVKLGAGGLVRAYSNVTADCLDDAKIVNMVDSTVLKITTEYDGYSKILKLVNSDVIITDTVFGNFVECFIAVKTELLDKFLSKLSDLFKGKKCFEITSNTYYSF